MTVLLFEDRQVDALYPITIGRPAYAITCGSYRLTDVVERLGETLRICVREHLQTIQKFDRPAWCEPLPADEPWLLMLCARAVPALELAPQLSEWLEEPTPGVIEVEGQIAAALVDRRETPEGMIRSLDTVQQFLESEYVRSLPRRAEPLPLFRFPHEVVAENMRRLNPALEDRLRRGDYRELADGVFAAHGARLGEYVVTDTSEGPIILDEDVKIGPYSYLAGPVYLGPHCKVLEHSAIKDAVTAGSTTKIGGEVEASVIEPYTNKQHHGFLGHSYLGSWINLGAGTCNSDLKNTYGMVKMQYGEQNITTGMQFLGCIMGDYSKTAINTGIFTGKVIGVCSMLYGFITTNVPSFVNYARLFGQVSEMPPEVMVATQQRMFARRKVEQRACDAQLMHDMYRLTHHERRLAGEPLVL